MKYLKIIFFLFVLLVSGCGTTDTSRGGTNLPASETAQANSVQKVSTQDVSVSPQSNEPKNENVTNQKTDSSAIPQSKNSMSAAAPSASLSASFVSPSPYAWVANQPLTVSWTVKNTTQKDVAFNLVLTDLTDSRIIFNSDLNLNTNFPSAKFENGIYSWIIPATYISSQGYTLQENHKYKLSLHTYVKWDGQGISPYKAYDCSTQFSVDSSKAKIPAPIGKLGVSLSFQQTTPQDGKSFHFIVTVTAGGKPLPDANVSIDLHSSTQRYLQNLITSVNGSADFYGGIFDSNPLTANVTVKAIGQEVTASGTYQVKY